MLRRQPELFTMVAQDRYLQFENVDLAQPVVSSRCTCCGAEFSAKPKPAELDAALEQIREAFDAHECGKFD